MLTGVSPPPWPRRLSAGRSHPPPRSAAPQLPAAASRPLDEQAAGSRSPPPRASPAGVVQQPLGLYPGSHPRPTPPMLQPLRLPSLTDRHARTCVPACIPRAPPAQSSPGYRRSTRRGGHRPPPASTTEVSGPVLVLFSSRRQDHEAAAPTSAHPITRSHQPAPAPLQLTARNAAALLDAESASGTIVRRGRRAPCTIGLRDGEPP